MTRPPSRSEKLLRDTLRKAEEHERLANPIPSGPVGPTSTKRGEKGSRRHRRSTTSSSVSTDVSFDAFDNQDEVNMNIVIARAQVHAQEQEDDDEWLWRSRRGTSASTDESSSSGNGHQQQHHTHTQQQAKLARNKSLDYGAGSASAYMRAYADSQIVQTQAQLAYGTPTSPSRVEPRRSSKSSPTVPKSRVHSNTVSGVYTSEGAYYETPHEAVLRSRLEGVLRGANRARSGERRKETGSGSGSGSGNSMASSRNLSGEGDFFFNRTGDVSAPLCSVALFVRLHCS